jgi:hypothetical protein
MGVVRSLVSAIQPVRMSMVSLTSPVQGTAGARDQKAVLSVQRTRTGTKTALVSATMTGQGLTSGSPIATARSTSASAT